MVGVGSGGRRRLAGCGECLDGYVQGECRNCGGRGCDECSGEGFLVAECEACGGTGTVPAASQSAAQAYPAGMSELEQAATLARHSEAMRETFEQAQPTAAAAKADRERRDANRADAEEARRAPARDRAERIGAVLAVFAAAALNLLYDYAGKPRPFWYPVHYDPLSLALTRAWFLAPLRPLVALAVSLLLWAPIAAVLRRAARAAAFQRYPAVAGAKPGKRPAPRKSPWYQLAGIIVIAGVIWLNHAVFPDQLAPRSVALRPTHRPSARVAPSFKVIGPLHIGVRSWRSGQDPTNIFISEGDRVTIHAAGSWTHGKEGDRCPYYGPEGYRQRKAGADSPCPNANLGALVYTIGDNSTEWAPVGRRFSFVAARSGQLFLTMNDQWNSFDDNDGVMGVSVTVKEPQ